MPYVRRDKTGTIVGHSVTEQQDAEEFLPDDHPEVVEYLAKFPPGFLTQPSPKKWQRMKRMHEQAQKDHETIRRLIAAFTLRFSELELSLSALLYVILNLPKTQVAYAIYYSPTSFDARVELVENALLQIISENENKLDDLTQLWTTIRGKINRCRNLRNAVAHSSQITHTINGKSYARLSPPAFDVIRVGRTLAKRQIPGLSASDLNIGCYNLAWTHDRVDEVNRLVAAFHAGDPTLSEKFLELEAGLKKQDSP